MSKSYRKEKSDKVSKDYKPRSKKYKLGLHNLDDLMQEELELQKELEYEAWSEYTNQDAE